MQLSPPRTAPLPIVVVLALATTSLPGCRQQPAPPAGGELATVDVSAPIDAEASLAEDGVERRARGMFEVMGVSGVLPEGFPRDIPLPVDSSLVDFADGQQGGIRLDLDVQASPEAALAAYQARLRSMGFAPVDGGLWQRGPRRIVVSVSSFSGAARIRVEHVPGP